MILHAAALIVLLAAPPPRLQELVELARAGKPLGKVSQATAREALVDLGARPEDVRPRVDVAMAGGAGRQAAAALLGLVHAESPAWSEALAALAALPAPVRQGAVRQAFDRLDATLVVEGVDPRLRDGAAQLLVEAVDETALVSRLGQWGGQAETRPAALALLAACPRSPRPVPLLEALASATLAEELYAPLRQAVHDLALASGEALEVVFHRATVGDRGTGDALLRALGAAPPSRYAQAAPPLVDLLAVFADNPTGVEPMTLAVAVEAAGELLVPELVPLLVPLTARGIPQEVRLRTIEAASRVGYRDQPTISLLIRLLSDPDEKVRLAAWESLKSKSGQRIPAQHEAWQRWLDGAKLPEQPPVTDNAERLTAERAIRLGGREPLRSPKQKSARTVLPKAPPSRNGR